MELNDKARQAVLEALKLDESQINSLNEDQSKVSSILDATVGENYLSRKRNDPDFGKDYHDTGYKKAEAMYNDKYRAAMKTIGLTEADMKDDSGAFLSTAELAKVAKEKLSQNPKNADIAKIQEEHLQAIKEKETEISSLQQLIETTKAQHQSELHGINQNIALRTQLSSIPDMIHSVDDAALLFPNKLGDFQMSLTKSGLEFKTEAGKYPEVDGKVIKSGAEYIAHKVKELGWIKAKEEGKPPTPRKVTGLGNGETQTKPLSFRELALLEAEKAAQQQ